MATLPSESNRSVSRSPMIFAGSDDLAARWADAIILVSRVVVGWLFFINGWQKLMNMSGTASYLTGLGVPAPSFWAWPAVLAELILGAALILGIATRYAALATFVYLIIATALAHRYWTYPQAQQTNQYNHFLKNIAIMGGALLIFVIGAGRLSIDAWLRRSNR